MADYQEIYVRCQQDFIEILIAEFAALGFDTFQENEDGFTTFVEGEFDSTMLNQLTEQYGTLASFSYLTKDVEKQNWNEEWEKHYEPIVVEEKCIVKAPFHINAPSYPIELLITPKMSFGTGHHLNNGSLIVSPFANGNRVLGGVDPDTGLTYGFDPRTGDPERGSTPG